ncbi:MAG: dihydrofolate reductase [Sphingobacteriaceae bacterium]|nr:dihydrofolate reductase [Sphingobacteriaceae bacterium]
MKSKVLVKTFIATSLDGYVAGEQGELDFLEAAAAENEDYGYADWMAQVGTVLVGRKSYDKVLSFGEPFAYEAKDCVVWTRQAIESRAAVSTHSGDLAPLIARLRAEGKGHVYADGGGELIRQLLREGLIDEMVISVLPVLLGKGTSLFAGLGSMVQLELLEEKRFPKLLQLRYKVVGLG